MGVLKNDGTPYIAGVDSPADVPGVVVDAGPDLFLTDEEKPSIEDLYAEAITKLRKVRTMGRAFARSGNPGRRAAGEAILGELE